MKKKAKKTIITSVTLISLFISNSFVLSVFADTSIYQTETIAQNNYNTYINKLDKYVSLDKDKLQFSISDEAKGELTNQEYRFLLDRVNETNKIYSNIDKTKDVTISTENKTIIIQENIDMSVPSARSSYKEGKTDIKGYWWGSRVWLSRTTIRNIGEGVGLAGIWIPKHVIAASVATMGWALTKVPGGVVFNWTPGLPSPIWGNEWQ